MATVASSPIRRAMGLYACAARLVDRFQPIFAFAIRLYVAKVFFFSGLTKARDWGTRRALRLQCRRGDFIS
jgi:hypothetical protein